MRPQKRGNEAHNLVYWPLNQSSPANHPDAALLLWNSEPAIPRAPYLCPDNHLPRTRRLTVVLRGLRVARSCSYAARTCARFHRCSFRCHKCCEKKNLKPKRSVEMWINCLNVSLRVSTFCQHGNYCVGFPHQSPGGGSAGGVTRTSACTLRPVPASQRAGSSRRAIVFFRGSRYIFPPLPVEFRHQIKSPCKSCNVKFNHWER